MSISARPTTTLATVSLLAVAALLSAGPAGAAPPAPGGQRDAGQAPATPGKGDSDHDRVADDLEAALAAAAPGERVGIILQGATPDAGRRAAPSLQVDQRYRSIPAFAGSVTAGQVGALSRVPGVTRIELNGRAHALDASGNLDYGVNAARGAGAATDGTLDGSGVGICFIDTGIDPNHEQLSGRVVGWRDWVNARPTPYDDHGHGTHVAGIAAGRPTGPTNTAYGGVATGASLISAKVLDSTGSGSDANVVSAIEWCAARPDVKVISMSLGSPGSDGSDAGSQASDAAVDAGKVVVVAAGNSGDAPGTISSPGVATKVVTVGAASDPSSLAGSSDTDTSLYLAGFSSRGPTTNPSAPHKPDLAAPGLSVVAPQAGTVSSYTTMSGTSMATPFVAGVVALGIEATPAASPATLKAALRSSARDAGAAGVDDEWGAGLVDARSFLAALGAASPGTAPWPGHTVVEGSVGSGAVRDYPVAVTTSGSPLGVTLRTTNGAATCVLPVGGSCWYGYEWAPDLDAYLVNPAGTVVAMSRCMLESTNGNCAAPGRFETIGVASAAAGTWTLRVESFSGSGSFQADVFGALGAPPPSPPSAPTGLSATAASSTSVNLAWTDTSSDETGFAIERCTGSGCSTFSPVTTLAANATGYSDTGRTAGTTYGYRVRAVRNADASSWTSTAYATTPAPPAAPSNLTASATSSTAVALAWTDNAGDETGFAVDRCSGVGCTPTTQVATLGADSRSFTDAGLTASTTYGYRVRALRGADTSAPSNIAAATTEATPPGAVPSAPSGLTATATVSAVTLRWTDTSNNEDNFRIERCQGTKCTPQYRNSVPANSISYQDTGLTRSTTYRYRLQACNATGCSAYTPIVTVKTLR
ncbi:MAG TPA: S8 family serine peptidase [Ornithinibacter sp.]|nr:S8 family serine peptidase [Ornithinibacter sp.]